MVKAETTTVIEVEPLLVGAAEAARLLGVSRSMLYLMLDDGSLGPQGFKFGTKRIFSLDELRSWISADCPGRDRWLAMRGGL